MTSQFEDTKVDDLDVGSYTEAQLKDIAENDSRSTAQEKATAELNRRADTASDTTTPQDTPGLSAQDEKERNDPQPEAPVLNSVGEEVGALSEEAGAGQVQHKLNAANVSGTFPGDGYPPDGSHTVEAVTQTPAADPQTYIDAVEEAS